MKNDLVKHSKFLSLVLRHSPETIGITLSESGWVNIDVLLEAMETHGHILSRDVLTQVVEQNDKKRFAISEDGEMIRASQGHTVEVDLQYKASVPPIPLYHGTVEKFIESIRKKGLIKGERHHVHMSVDVETAEKVGGRRAKNTEIRILVIDTKQMYADGFQFFKSENGVWLTDHVPAKYITFP